MLIMMRDITLLGIAFVLLFAAGVSLRDHGKTLQCLSNVDYFYLSCTQSAAVKFTSDHISAEQYRGMAKSCRLLSEAGYDYCRDGK